MSSDLRRHSVEVGICPVEAAKSLVDELESVIT